MTFSIKVSTYLKTNLFLLSLQLGRYFLITIPFYSNPISKTIASTLGITNAAIGGYDLLNYRWDYIFWKHFLMLFHPQKRGLHDILLKSVVVPNNQIESLALKSFTLKPLLSGIIGIAILSFTFGNLIYQADKDPDFSSIKELSEKIRKESSIPNIGASYTTSFAMSGKQTMFAIQVEVPISNGKFDDEHFTEELSNKLYPLVKKINTNPKVDTIIITFHATKYIGAFPINKVIRLSRKLSEIY